MKNIAKRSGFTPQEHLVSILPAIIIGIILMFTTVASALVSFPPQNLLHRMWLVICGLFGILHLVFYYFTYNIAQHPSRYVWINAIFAAGVFCALSYLLPYEIKHLIYIMVFISALPASLLTNRGPAHALLFGVTTFHFILNLSGGLLPHQLITHIGFTITAFIGIETIQQLRTSASRHIKRLEIINELSKQIVSTLETKQVFALLNAALQNALEADAYYIGTVHGDRLHLELLYDDGEYFQDLWVDKKGTLSNWVITHQQGLFLPDLRKEIELDDVEVITVGKDKPTLSWMGVPMRGTHVDGAIAISSYRPNAFDRSALELLYNIAQRAALALDNAHHHALVEKQAQLDSLTEVYNHGYFIKVLHEQAKACQEQNQPLSLIMLDIDYFKQYNDTFGHLIGDEVLIGLCNVIRQHIKNTDVVGRWGGEEFAISLPNANEEQAIQVAQRIRESMASLNVKDAEQMTIPVPTVSQGIAVFPVDMDDTTKLIDLADKRLYIAKKRGRDQVESAFEFVAGGL
jgi:diguanylate cyclase (GGDEF)-like protein